MYKIIKKSIPRTLINKLRYNNLITRFIQKSYYNLFNYPKTLQLHINTECNFNCKYCYSKKVVKNRPDWMNIITQAKKLKLKRIEFLGGEPFFDKKIKDYIKKCEKERIDLTIYTNAILLTDEMIDFLTKLKISLLLVIKFDDKECYERYTTKNKKFYENLINIIKKCRRKNIKTIGHIIITKKNINKINYLLNLSKKLDVIPTFERYMPINKDLDKELEIDSKEWGKALEYINKFYRTLDQNFLVSSIIKGNTCSCYIDLYLQGQDTYLPGSFRCGSSLCKGLSGNHSTWLYIF